MNPTTSRANLIYEIAKMELDDYDRLADTLARQYQSAYRAEYNRLLRAGGVRLRRVLVLDDQTRQTIAAQADQDATSVTNTYNNDLQRQINRLLAENPNFTRQEIKDRLDVWNFNRESWKNPQVALNSNRQGAQLALSDFYARNKDAFKTTMKAVPSSAVCERCQAMVDAGVVDWSFAQANPFPFHVNCNHSWVVVGMEQIGEIHVDSLQQIITRQFRR